MVKRDFLIRGRFIGGENTANDVTPGGGAAYVGEVLITEGFNDVVEVSGGGYRKPSEKDSAGGKKAGIKPIFVGFNGVDKGRVEVWCKN